MNLLSDEEQSEFEIQDLVNRLNRCIPPGWRAPLPEHKRIPRPVYRLLVDELEPFALVVIIRTGEGGVTRGLVGVPQHGDLPEFHEGPFSVVKALRIADRWAYRYGYEEVHVDIESSQLWDKAWGELEMPVKADFARPFAAPLSADPT